MLGGAAAYAGDQDHGLERERERECSEREFREDRKERRETVFDLLGTKLSFED